jgi:hypothetical protein
MCESTLPLALASHPSPCREHPRAVAAAILQGRSSMPEPQADSLQKPLG